MIKKYINLSKIQQRTISYDLSETSKKYNQNPISIFKEDEYPMTQIHFDTKSLSQSSIFDNTKNSHVKYLFLLYVSSLHLGDTSLLKPLIEPYFLEKLGSFHQRLKYNEIALKICTESSNLDIDTSKLSHLQEVKNYFDKPLYSKFDKRHELEKLEYFEKSKQVQDEIFGDTEVLVDLCGGQKIRGVDINRSNNTFQHQYYTSLSNEVLVYDKKPDIDDLINEEIQKDADRPNVSKIADQIREDKKNSYAYGIKNSINRFASAQGISSTTNTDIDKNLDLRELGEKMAKQTEDYKASMKSDENYIMYSEFEIISQIKLDYFDLNGNNLSDKEHEKQSKHYIRLEKPIFKQDNSTEIKNRVSIMADFDYFMRGNPYGYVKKF